MKYTATMDDDLMRKIDERADAEYTTRSGLIARACSQYLEAYKTADAVKELSSALVQLNEKGLLDEYDLQELKGLNNLLRKAFS